MERTLRALAGYRIPVPADVLRRLDPDGPPLDALVASGRIVVDGRGYRLHPLATPPPPLEPGRLLDALEPADHRDGRLLVERSRLAFACGRSAPVPRWTRALLIRAIVAGLDAETGAELVASGVAARLLAGERALALRLLYEAGRPASEVEGLLAPDDPPIRARRLVRDGHPREAIAALGSRTDDEARLVRARALLNLGLPDEALEAIPAAASTPWAELERTELLALGWLETGRADEAVALLAARADDPLLELHLGTLRARAALRLGRLGEATTALAGVRTGLEALPAPRVRAVAEFVDALVAFYAGNHARLVAQLRRLEDLGFVSSTTVWKHAAVVELLARSAWDEAEALARSLAGPNDYGMRNMLSFVALQRGRLEEARALLAEARGTSVLFRDEVAWLTRLLRHRAGEPVGLAERPSANAIVRLVDGLLDGEVLLDRGDEAAAAAVLARCAALVDRHGIGARRADLALLGADLAARAGRTEEALHRLEVVRSVAVHPDAPAARLAEAATAAIRGTLPAPEVLARWRVLPDPEALAVAEGRSRRFRVPRAGPVLRVARDGRWFAVDGDAPVDLGRRAAARRILARLVEARVEGTAVLDAAELVAAGWPGERILPEAAINRLHVALHGLRGLGLQGWILRDADGWTLDPAREVVRAETDQKPRSRSRSASER